MADVQAPPIVQHVKTALGVPIATAVVLAAYAVVAVRVHMCLLDQKDDAHPQIVMGTLVFRLKKLHQKEM